MKKLLSLLVGTLLLIGAGCATTSALQTTDADNGDNTTYNGVRVDTEVDINNDSANDVPTGDDDQTVGTDTQDNKPDDSGTSSSTSASNSDYTELEDLGNGIDSDLGGVESGELEF